MTVDDLKWAVGELVASVLSGPHRNCACHKRLEYRDPAAQHPPSGDAGTADQRAPSPGQP